MPGTLTPPSACWLWQCKWAAWGGAGGRGCRPEPEGLCVTPARREDSVLLLNPALGDRLVVSGTDQLLSAFIPPEEPAVQPARWLEASEEECQGGLRLRICHGKVWGLLAGGVGMEGGGPAEPALPPAASDTGDLARAWGLHGRGAGRRGPHAGADPPAEPAPQPKPLPPQPRTGAAGGLPPCATLPAGGFPAQHPPLPPVAPGAHQKAKTELQVGVQPGSAPRR